MIPHPVALDQAYGVAPVAPYCRVQLTNPDGSSVTLTPSEGRWRSDDAQWPRTTVDLVLPTAITPEETTNPVSPFGGRVTVTIGATVPGLGLQTFTLGTLDVDTVAISRPEGTIAVHAVSREARVNENRAASSEDTWPAGNVTDLVIARIRAALGPSYPASRWAGITDKAIAAASRTLGNDIWGAIDDLTDEIDVDVYFSSDGTAILRPSPVKAAAGVIRLRGGNGGSLTGYETSQRWGPNRVYLPFRAPSATPGVYTRVVGVWQDNNPASITYIGGAYGQHSLQADPIDVPTLAQLPTQAAADAAAAARARRNVRIYRQITARAIPAPWLEPGDTVAISTLNGADQLLLLSSVEFPLGQDDVMTLTFADDAVTTVPSFGG